MRMKLIRFWCSLWGCKDTVDYGYCCDRCGETYYAGWYEYGRMRWLQSAWYRLRRGWPRCAECGKLMKWKQRHDTCCSDECYDKMGVPF